MKKMAKMFWISTMLVFVFTFVFNFKARGEMFVSAYLGVSSTLDSDVELSRPGGTSLTFSDVGGGPKKLDSMISSESAKI